MRDRDVYLAISCGPVGTRGIGNHKHNDLLSFELQAQGRDLFVDRGSYLYTPDPVGRNAFRSTAAHNTVLVDGQEQNRFGAGSLFWLHADATPRVLLWETTPAFDRFLGEHDGYTRLPDPVLHRREVRLEKAERRVEITDTLTGRGRHELTWTFTLAPGLTLRRDGELTWELEAGGRLAVWRLLQIQPEEAWAGLQVEVADAEVSPRYGVRRPARALRLRTTTTLPALCRLCIQLGDAHAHRVSDD
jgi:hypothetical protein